jgi:predicted aldo/keto reductase-like oxidoreductase
MRYRVFGKTGLQVSELSLGCMRFPSEQAAFRIVNEAIDQGINYYETSVGYLNGKSERWLGRALGKRRGQVMVSTKSHTIEKGQEVRADEVRRLIDMQLERLLTDYVDFYHGWSVSRPLQYEACIVKGGWYEGVLKAKEQGLVKHIGITTHAPPDMILKMIDDGRWEVITIQYSLLLQSYREIIHAAHKKGTGVMIMGPLAGGLLTLPSELLSGVFTPLDQISGAFRYVLSDPAVSSVASGMRSPSEVKENTAIIDRLPEDLTIAYQDTINGRLYEALGEGLEQFEAFFCGGCRYCLSVCPENIGPHNIFKAYNMMMLKGDPADKEKIAMQTDRLLSRCIHCGACQEICPQDINVPEHLERVRDTFLQDVMQFQGTATNKGG